MSINLTSGNGLFNFYLNLNVSCDVKIPINIYNKYIIAIKSKQYIKKIKTTTAYLPYSYTTLEKCAFLYRTYLIG